VPAPFEQRAKRSAISAMLMVVVVPIDHFAVDWWRTLHQDSSLQAAKDNLDAPFLFAMMIGFVAMTLVYAWLVVHRYRLEQLEERLETEGLELALAERRAEALSVTVGGD
jgi:heme exporter protein C